MKNGVVAKWEQPTVGVTPILQQEWDSFYNDNWNMREFHLSRYKLTSYGNRPRRTHPRMIDNNVLPALNIGISQFWKWEKVGISTVSI